MRNITSGACVVLLAVLGGSLAGCGSSAKVENNTSVGQQLQDLEAAHDKGLLTDDEYQKQRKRILDGN